MSGPLTNTKPRCVNKEPLEIPPSLHQPPSIHEVIQEMRNRKVGTDLVFKGKCRKHYCHKDVVSLYSTKIAQRINKDDKKQVVISVFDVSDDTQQVIVNWMYAGGLKARQFITWENVQEVMEGASSIGVRDLQELCLQVIQQISCPITALKRLQSKGSSLDPAVFQRLQKVVFAKIGGCFKQEEFKALSAEDLQYLLMQDQLEIENEEAILDAIISWVEHDWAKRRKFKETLLMLVRFGNIDCSILVLLQHSPKYRPYLTEAQVDDQVQKAIRFGVIKEKYGGKNERKYQKRLAEEGLSEPQPRKYDKRGENKQQRKSTGPSGDY